jgi:hypothetical protein
MFEPVVYEVEDNHSGEIATLFLNTKVSADLIEETERLWRPELRRLRSEALARGVPENKIPLEHEHWNWKRKYERAITSDHFWGFVLNDGGAQAVQALLMMSDTPAHRGRLAPQFGEPLIYIEYIEVAPWNLRPLNDRPRFTELGPALFEQAVEFSRSLGYQGRLALHSLDQSVTFYRRCGMTECERERMGLSLYEYTYFEMTPKQARKFVEGW